MRAGDRTKPSANESRLSESLSSESLIDDFLANARRSTRAAANPADDEEESSDLEIDEIRIDEAKLPQLDTEDPETLALEQAHDDLLDRRWLEKPVEDEDDDERSALDQLGFTIELNAAGAEDDAEVVDLDIGDLLEPLAADGADGDSAQERGELSFGVAALHEVLLPESEEQHDEREVGDDERFPAFDTGVPAWRPGPSDEEGPEGEPFSS